MLLRDRFEVTLVVEQEDWRAMRHAARDARVEGDFRLLTFDIELPWNVVGFLARVTEILSAEGVSAAHSPPSRVTTCSSNRKIWAGAACHSPNSRNSVDGFGRMDCEHRRQCLRREALGVVVAGWQIRCQAIARSS